MKSNPLIKLRKGAWAPEEDNLLRKCIEKYGEGKWNLVPERAGLNRCRKSCRLRWVNYLRPSIKRGEFGEDEVDLIMRLHKLLGNRWSLIAGRLPGRTANDVKNYWNTNLQKRSDKNGSCQKEALKSEELIRWKGETSNISTSTSTVVIKPLPRTLSKGTTVPCYSPPIYISSSLNKSEDYIYSTKMLTDHDKPQSPEPIPPDQDGIEWWKKLLDEIGIAGEEEQEESSQDLLMLSSSITSTGVLKADGQNGWSDIWDILNADSNIN